VEAARLDTEPAIAVSIRAAAPSEVLSVLARAHALTARERQLVELTAAGLDTRQIASRLFISSHTAKDHLKSVFAKMGLHSHRELLAGGGPMTSMPKREAFASQPGMSGGRSGSRDSLAGRPTVS
jgi:DNA-binding CsgD family transcriptional regulator